jgi:hypothetical protein
VTAAEGVTEAKTVTITMTVAETTNWEGSSNSVTINVLPEPKDWSIDASDMELHVGDAPTKINARVGDYDGTLTYTSGTKTVVTVDSEGNLTPLKKGKSTITITAPATAGYSNGGCASQDC